jgi:hypothetical protein
MRRIVIGMGRGNGQNSDNATGATLRGAPQTDEHELATLAEEHGVANLHTMSAVASTEDLRSTATATHRGDRKAITSFAADLRRSPKYQALSDERITDLAERLYAAAYQKARIGQTTPEQLAALASRRGESIGDLRAELERELTEED